MAIWCHNGTKVYFNAFTPCLVKTFLNKCKALSSMLLANQISPSGKGKTGI